MLRFPLESATRVTDTAIIRTDTTDPIRTMAPITGLHITGTTGIGFITIATTVIIITTAIGTKLT